ncbi:YfgG family protein [Edaphovirga cremea]|uniref:YfgG family protein n=1 Tax=Edaphovirga cremea TaxID=2267246 RepID=UPI000DEEE958|nr:YfgG family protein [Edaphovirga cremea]
MRRKTNIQMTKIVLVISFIILFGRMIYAGVGAIFHHQDKQKNQIEQPVAPAATTKKLPD